MQKTKILFFLPNLNGGGAERVTVNILRQLEIENFNISLALVEKAGNLMELIPPKIKIIDLKSKKTVLSIFKLRKVILNLNPDIIFSTLIRTHIAVDLALLGLDTKPRLIFRSPSSPKLLLENNQLNWLMRTFVERAYANADVVIAQTPEMKKEIEYYHGISKNKVVFVLNPLDTDFIDEKIRDIKNPFDTSFINVVAAGRLSHQKGFDILIQSFKQVVDRDNNFRLYIIGNDVIGEKKSLIATAKFLNIDKHIFFLDHQTNPYIYYYYSDLYVLSSRWEGLPNTVLESLYLKKPVVSTKCIPFMNVLIKNKKNGILVDIEDPDGLANAILEYQAIDTEYTTIDFKHAFNSSIFCK